MQLIPKLWMVDNPKVMWPPVTLGLLCDQFESISILENQFRPFVKVLRNIFFECHVLEFNSSNAESLGWCCLPDCL